MPELDGKNYQEELRQNGELYLRCKVIPNAPKTEHVETLKSPEGTTLKIKVHAVPEKGKANRELIRFLAQVLAISKEQITIVSGHTTPLKLIHVVLPK